MTKKLNLRLGVSAVSILFACMVPTVASAQDEDSAEDQSKDVITITGSRIRGIDPVGSPVVGLGREEIEMSPSTTTTELLSELPQVFNLGATDASFTSANNQNANRTYGTGINLRGLGTESTLTLLDGRRLPASGTQSQFFDPSVIPSMAISRVEVLADGSSGIYGSDAVGGVVNIMLREGFQGAELSARAKMADGYEEYQAGAAFGQTWGGGSFMIAGEYTDRDFFFARDRDFYTDDLRPYGGPDLRSTFAAPGNVTVDGVNYAIPDGDGVGLAPGDFTAGTQNLQSSYLTSAALPKQERYGIASTFEQELTPWATFYLQGVLAHRDGTNQGGALTASFDVPDTNPFYVNPGTPGERVTVSYSFLNELGPEQSTATTDFWHVHGGIDFDISADWSGNVFFAEGRDEQRSFNRSVNNGALGAALADTNPATAFNPFSSTGNNNAATMSAIAGGSFRVDTNFNIREYGVSADGPIFDLPAGEVKLATGVTRQEIEWQDLAPFVTDFSRQVDSVFGELYIPIMGGNGGPSLGASIAGRYDDYEGIGDTTNPKIGVNFVPVPSLTLRSSYGKSFRAPSLADTGMPFNQYATFIDGTNTPRQVLFIRGANPDLTPETAETWSFGADFEPEEIDGLRLSVTYYDVEYTNRIATPGNDRAALQKAELAPIVDINPDLARVQEIIDGGLFSAVPASPSDVYAIVDGRKLNIGATETNGVEFLGSYQTEMDWGTLSLGVNAVKILEFKRSVVPGVPLKDVVNTINNPAGFVARAHATASFNNNLSTTAFLNHLGSYDNDTVNPVQEVEAHTEIDLALRYGLGGVSNSLDGVTLSLDVQDLFDNDPPYVQIGNLAFDPNAHSAIGRTVTVGVRARF